MTHLIISALCYAFLSYLALAVALFVIIELQERKHTNRNRGRK